MISAPQMSDRVRLSLFRLFKPGQDVVSEPGRDGGAAAVCHSLGDSN